MRDLEGGTLQVLPGLSKVMKLSLKDVNNNF